MNSLMSLRTDTKGLPAPPPRYIVLSLSGRVYFAREPFLFRLMRFCQTQMSRRIHRVKTVLKQRYSSSNL